MMVPPSSHEDATRQNCSEGNRHASGSNTNGIISTRQPRLRASCDACTRSKLRCDGDKPACGRCSDRQSLCTYSPVGRVGRPPGPRLTTKSNLAGDDDNVSPTLTRPRERPSLSQRRASMSLSATLRTAQGQTGGYRSEISGPDLREAVLEFPSTDVAMVDSISIPSGGFWEEWVTADGAVMALSPASRLTTGTGLTPTLTPASGPRGSPTLAFAPHPDQQEKLQPDDFLLDTALFTVNDDGNNDGKSTTATQSPTMVQPSPITELEEGTNQFDAMWQNILGGVKDLHQIISFIAPGASMSTTCTCPTLLGALQLLATHPRLAACPTTRSPNQADRRHPRYLDLLLFFDCIVRRTVLAVSSCNACSKSRSTQLALCIHVDWLVNLLTEMIEHGLKDGSGATACHLRLDSFHLDGELWQICIRELLMSRLVKLSQILQTYIDGPGGGSDVSSVPSSDPSRDRVLMSFAPEVLAKVELLFGRLDLWDARGSMG